MPEISKMTKEYANKFTSGLIYQDYAIEGLRLLGLSLSAYAGQSNQNRGETKAGVEIKNDTKFRDTGNLYIEYQEKSDPKNSIWVDSGCLKDDGCWAWFQGDFEGGYMLNKRMLKRIYSKWCEGKFYLRSVKSETSKGFLLPIVYIMPNSPELKFDGVYLNYFDFSVFPDRLLERPRVARD